MILCCIVRTRLTVSLSFMIIAIIITFVAVIFVFPLFHRGFFLIGALCGFAGGNHGDTLHLYYWSLVMCSMLKHTSIV